MRYMNCREVRRNIEDVGNGKFLNANAQAHIQGCAACATLAGKQANLHSILSSLGTIETPHDFNFRLKARLAAEKQSSYFAIGGFSFGYRFAAVAAALLIASAVVIVGYRNAGPNQTPQVATNEERVPAATTKSGQDKAAATDLAKDNSNNAVGNDPQLNVVPKRRAVRPETVAYRGSRVGTRDVSNTQATVLRRYDELADGNPDGAIPINASYQSLKVSVDNGKGGSRTISLPTVSFGSQRTVSQNPAPMMASNRGVW